MRTNAAAERIGHIGDVDPILHGGGYVFQHGDDGYVLEYFDGLVDEADEDDQSLQLTVYRVGLFKSGREFLDWYNWVDWGNVLRSFGKKPSEAGWVYGASRLNNLMERAHAVQDAAGYYGWHEFDTEPLTITLSKLKKRWADKNPSSSFKEDFLEGAARTFFVSAYADFVEEPENETEDLPRPGGGEDWGDYAPETPVSAYRLADEMWHELEEVNRTTVLELAERAERADGEPPDPEEFGSDLAMQYMGHGVSWFDDHKEFPIKVPHGEVSAYTFDESDYHGLSRNPPSDQDIYDADDLATLLGLPKFDQVENDDAVYEAGLYVAKEGGTDEEIQEAEEEAQGEQWTAYLHALESVAEQLLEHHGLALHQKGKATNVWVVKPETSWKDAANKIRTTINGVGMFEFSSLKDFLDSGPYTAKEATLSHLGYVKRWPEVYGSGSPRGMFDRAMR